MPRFAMLLRLALPIMGGMLSQSLLNLIDAALVGALGDTALAGVGIGGYGMFMVTALLFGLSSGVQSQTARRHGERLTMQRAEALNAGLIIALCLAIPLSLAGFWQAPRLMAWLNDTPAIREIATSYFRWRIVGLLPVALTFCFRGYWYGIQRTDVYLRIMLVTQVVNVAASAGLIYGWAGLPRLGPSGAGAGTTLSLLLGVILWALLSVRQARASGFLARCPSLLVGLNTLRLAAPHSLQQFCFAAGYAMLFWILGHIGGASVAVGHVLVNLSLLMILPGVGLGLAAMSLVGQSLGQASPEEAHRWGWDAVRLAWLCLALLALPMLVVPELLLGLFFHDDRLVALGSFPLRLTAIMIVLDAAAIVLAQALLGAGAHRAVMKTTLLLQWLVFLPLAWWIAVTLDYGLAGIWWVQLGYRCANSLCFVAIWQRRRWQSLAV
ncbi:MATE family efflux transporter [Chromohalobacter sp. HP20-39]|uniref:MATE family efflux transporter n=1 Tax=Chromohalobacter sp. HP20-39 TaxID=3079306 RepID=UPI00294B14FA|nr:MATE family efflux transporter [Chromohalobacter sp. HP20-39]MDV6319236.1 MATE family efflux transporter [Chromohalobacter sp. HP20-39]